MVLLFAAALAAAVARGAVLERLRGAGPAVKRWTARVLIAVGIWLLALAGFAGSFARIFPV